MARRSKRSSDDVTDWHRLFGIVLTQLFEGFDWKVERELDLSIKQQLLDIVIIRRGRGRKTPILPDGFGPLADHNLLTYKSLHEPLDGWAMKELVGHSVNYRKQVSPSLDELLPEESFRLFAIATRFPEKLASKVTLQAQSVGVYDVAWGTDTIRLLVLKEIPAADRNMISNLFSAEPMRIVAGVSQFRSNPHELSYILEELLKKYHGEPDMPQTLEEMLRDSRDRVEKRLIAETPVSRFVEEMSLDKLRETQALIAQRLADAEKQKATPSRATKGRRKAGTTGS